MVVVVGLLVPVMLLAVVLALSLYEDLLFPPPPAPQAEPETAHPDASGL